MVKTSPPETEVGAAADDLRGAIAGSLNGTLPGGLVEDAGGASQTGAKLQTTHDMRSDGKSADSLPPPVERGLLRAVASTMQQGVDETSAQPSATIRRLPLPVRDGAPIPLREAQIVARPSEPKRPDLGQSDQPKFADVAPTVADTVSKGGGAETTGEKPAVPEKHPETNPLDATAAAISALVRPRPKAPMPPANGLDQAPKADAPVHDRSPNHPRANDAPQAAPLPTEAQAIAARGPSGGEARTDSAPQEPPRNDAPRQEPAPERAPSAARRPVAPTPRPRLTTTEQRPSIGTLIFALQQKPSTKPFQVAAIASGVWLLIGSIFVYATLGTDLLAMRSWTDAFLTPSLAIALATLGLPIALFWFLALLAWRSSELRLMSSAMTEVAVRLAEPDKMAEQSVASLSQSVRRQVTAMNDAIARAVGRAGELEALVHNEVAALERSYSENEIRIRGLINELSSERDALANNSERIALALQGLGHQVTHDIVAVSDRIHQALDAATGAIDDRLADRGLRITEAITKEGMTAADRIEQSGQKAVAALHAVSEETALMLTDKGNQFFAALNTASENVKREIPALLERLGTEQVKLSRIIEGAGKNLAALESALGKHSGELQASLTTRTQELQVLLANSAKAIDANLVERARALDSALATRVQQIDAAFAERGKALDQSLAGRVQQIDARLVDRTKEIDQAFAERMGGLDRAIRERTGLIDSALEKNRALLLESMDGQHRALRETLGRQAAAMDDTMGRGIMVIQETTNALTSNSSQSVETLATQTELLKRVSEALLDKIQGLTNRFENQGQSIMKAAHALESSSYKIDTVLEARQGEIGRLVDTLTSRANELNETMRVYSGELEHSVTEAQRRAMQITESVTRDSRDRSLSAVSEFERMRNEAQAEAERTLSDLRERFGSVRNEVTQEFGSLSHDVRRSTEEFQSAAKTSASELARTQAELRDHLDRLPKDTRESTAAVRRALSDQLRALERLSALTEDQRRRADIAPPLPAGSNRGSRDARALPQSSSYRAGASGNSRSRPLDEAGPDISRVTASLAKQLQDDNALVPGMKPAPTEPSEGSWKLGDLLARASIPEDIGHGNRSDDRRQVAPIERAVPAPSPRRGLDLDQLSRAMDRATASEIWYRLRNGERGFLGAHVYTAEGVALFEDCRQRCATDPSFRGAIERYVMDFERLVAEAQRKDPSGGQAQRYMNSETGRVYLVLAHASGRIG